MLHNVFLIRVLTFISSFGTRLGNLLVALGGGRDKAKRIELRPEADMMGSIDINLNERLFCSSVLLLAIDSAET